MIWRDATISEPAKRAMGCARTCDEMALTEAKLATPHSCDASLRLTRSAGRTGATTSRIRLY